MVSWICTRGSRDQEKKVWTGCGVNIFMVQCFAASLECRPLLCSLKGHRHIYVLFFFVHISLYFGERNSEGLSPAAARVECQDVVVLSCSNFIGINANAASVKVILFWILLFSPYSPPLPAVTVFGNVWQPEAPRLSVRLLLTHRKWMSLHSWVTCNCVSSGNGVNKA